MNSSCKADPLRSLAALQQAISILRVPKFIELVNRDQDRRRLTLLGQHDTFMVTLRARH